MNEGRLVPRTHEFFCAPLSFHELPEDLAVEFACASMTILKGDLNYRRLVGDRDRTPTASFADLTAYFPSPVTALRTLKSDVVSQACPPTGWPPSTPPAAPGAPMANMPSFKPADPALNSRFGESGPS